MIYLYAEESLKCIPETSEAVDASTGFHQDRRHHLAKSLFSSNAAVTEWLELG